jgi:hypothetical protein
MSTTGQYRHGVSAVGSLDYTRDMSARLINRLV